MLRGQNKAFEEVLIKWKRFKKIEENYSKTIRKGKYYELDEFLYKISKNQSAHNLPVNYESIRKNSIILLKSIELDKLRWSLDF